VCAKSSELCAKGTGRVIRCGAARHMAFPLLLLMEGSSGR